MSVASKTVKCLDEKVQCCEAIKDSGKCRTDYCPLWSAYCLEDTDFSTIAYEVDEKQWSDFVEAAEKAEPELTKEEYEALEWDVRRNDPDDM